MPNLDKATPGPRFGLIADDLTGACDSSVQFAVRGFSTAVCIGSSPAAFSAFDLVALNTSSRNSEAVLAARKVREACDALLREQREVIFKKIDSTLRGNLATEIGAAMESCRFPLALVAPAYPAMGRTIEGGVLHVAGPAQRASANLESLLVTQGARQVVTFGRDAWGQAAGTLSEQLKALPDGTLATLDSIWDFDLEHIARAGLRLRGRALLVGSAGLAAATAKVLSEELRVHPSLAPATAESECAPRSSVFLMGSTHPVTRDQMEFLVRHGNAICIRLDAIAHREASEMLKSRRPLLITIEPGQDGEARLKEFIRILDRTAIRGIALSGGDTALAILRELGASGIKIEKEVLPGIPFGRVLGGSADGLAVVTKAGGFGKEDALVKIAEFLEYQGNTT